MKVQVQSSPLGFKDSHKAALSRLGSRRLKLSLEKTNENVGSKVQIAPESYAKEPSGR